MKSTCHFCKRTANWDPIKKGGHDHPDFVTKEHEGEMRTFCRGCWPPQEETDNKNDNTDH